MCHELPHEREFVRRLRENYLRVGFQQWNVKIAQDLEIWW